MEFWLVIVKKFISFIAFCNKIVHNISVEHVKQKELVVDISTLEHYAPVLIVVLWFIYQQHCFVTPEQLEKTHRLILEEVEKKYTTKVDSENLKESITDIKTKIDRIYDKLIGGINE